MASVKANVYVPPVEENEFMENLELQNLGISKNKIIYFLMIITMLLFIRKLISTVCRRHGSHNLAKDE